MTRFVREDAGRTSLRRSSPFHAPSIAIVLLIIILLGAVIVGTHIATHVDVNLFLADPAEKGLLPFYTGAYTYVGAVALFATSAVCLFAASLLGGVPHAPLGAPFLVTLGALAAWLGADDLFMFHEWAGLAIAEARGDGDPAGARSRLEALVFGAYGIAWLAWIVVFRRQIFGTRYGVLILALVSLAGSVAIDIGVFLFPALLPDTAWMPTTLAVAEEMLKLTGIFFLLAYAIDSSRMAILWPVDTRAGHQGR